MTALHVMAALALAIGLYQYGPRIVVRVGFFLVNRLGSLHRRTGARSDRLASLIVALMMLIARVLDVFRPGAELHMLLVMVDELRRRMVPPRALVRVVDRTIALIDKELGAP